MKQGILILTIALIVSSAKAENTATEIQLSMTERQEIASALHTLMKYKVIATDESNNVKFNSDILKRLQSEGLLTNESIKLMSICIGAGN
jgi:hypothetical protein